MLQFEDFTNQDLIIYSGEEIESDYYSLEHIELF